MKRLICLFVGHDWRLCIEVPIKDTPEAFANWNMSGNIARRGRYWFRARCRRCRTLEPIERTYLDFPA